MYLIKCDCGCFFTVKEIPKQGDLQCQNCYKKLPTAGDKNFQNLNAALKNENVSVCKIPDDASVQVNFNL